MIYGLVIVLHVLVCCFLVGVILVQGGRGGMAETLGGSAAQSLFGGGANIVMTKITALCAAVFMVTCITLALLSTRQGRSVIDRIPAALPSPVVPEPEGAAPPTPAPAPPDTTAPTQ